MTMHTSLTYRPIAYNALGSIPNDPILAQSRKATDKLLARMRSMPEKKRASWLIAELSMLDPTLPAKADKAINVLLRKGYNAENAMARAIQIESANALLNRFVATGKENLSGLGGLGNAGKVAGGFALNLLGGAACSDALRDLIADKVGTSSGREAAAYATIGADTLRGAAKCGPPPAAAAPAPPAPAAPPPAPAGVPIWPFVVGGLALVGVVVFIKAKS